MTTAFQPGAFQTNAFQIDAGTSPTGTGDLQPSLTISGTGDLIRLLKGVGGSGKVASKRPILIEKPDDTWNQVREAILEAEEAANKNFAKRIKRLGKAKKAIEEIRGRVEVLASHAPSEAEIRFLKTRVNETMAWMARQRKQTYDKLLADLQAKEDKARDEEEEEWLLML